MRILRAAVFAIPVLLNSATLSTAASRADPGYSYYEVGDSSVARPEPTEHALMLVGGGDWDRDAFRWFAAKAGHGNLVIVAASGEGEGGKEMYGEIGGFTSVRTIVFRSRKASFDARVLNILHHADGIFIAGGDQSNYVRYWKGTPVARAIDEKVAEGRPVGGTSAGLAILGASAYGAMDGGSIDSPTALADPLGPAVTIVHDFLHMPHMAHIVTDTHFAARNRLGRLIAFVAQVRATTDRRAVGLAIDEGSALCVDANGIGKFYTSKNGLAWLIEPNSVAKLSKGKPLDYPSVRITRFGTDGAIDLKTLQVTNPASSVVVSVEHGTLRGI